jgi:hypothetical protein
MAIGKQLSDLNPDGTSLGQSTTDKISFYGVTPVTQRAAAIQAASFVSVSTNATVGSAIAAFFAEVANTLVALGIWKGST